MSVTDRAFIEAYVRRDGAAPANLPQPGDSLAVRDYLYDGPQPMPPPPHRPANRQTNRQTDRPANSQTDSRTDSQVDSQVEFQPSSQSVGDGVCVCVARFEWPEVCRRLEEVIGDGLQRACDGLRREAATGRYRIGFAGCGSRVGCTTAMLALAMRLAQSGEGLALLDAAGQASDLADRLGLAAGGTEELVLTAATPAAELVLSRGDRAVVCATSGASGSAPDTNSAVEIAQVVTHLGHTAPLVLVDLGPNALRSAGAPAETLVRQRHIDGVLVVGRRADIQSMACRRLVADIESCGVNVLGVIETFTSLVERAA